MSASTVVVACSIWAVVQPPSNAAADMKAANANLRMKKSPFGGSRNAGLFAARPARRRISLRADHLAGAIVVNAPHGGGDRHGGGDEGIGGAGRDIALRHQIGDERRHYGADDAGELILIHCDCSCCLARYAST